jgi:hypothetical protein
VDENSNEITGDGVNGEAHVRSPSLVTSYADNPSATKEAFVPGGWLKTGDIAYVRCGKWYIVDRVKVLPLFSRPYSTATIPNCITIRFQSADPLLVCETDMAQQIGAHQNPRLASRPRRTRSLPPDASARARRGCHRCHIARSSM